LGFDAVFDTDFTADLTIMEEANEFLGRLENGPLPMITSCSPGWVSFLEKFYPELIPNTSSCKSPMSMLSTLVKTYYAEEEKLDPKKIFSVAVMPCVAKKYEATRPEHFTEYGVPYTDAVLTTRELIWMIKCYGISFNMLPESEFDTPLGIASGAGDIFGATGGVMEATLRTASKLVTGEAAARLEFNEVRAVEGLKDTYVAIGKHNIHVGVANGLTNAKVLLDKIVSGEEEFHVIEVMACPGGCVGGGGQPYPPAGSKVLDPELLRKRAGALYSIDSGKKLRQSYENPAIKELYERFLEKPGSEIAHKLLHTTYSAKLPRGIR
jgi:NADP-reducing hydrogenase subunit HndD